MEQGQKNGGRVDVLELWRTDRVQVQVLPTLWKEPSVSRVWEHCGGEVQVLPTLWVCNVKSRTHCSGGNCVSKCGVCVCGIGW